jgi:hypothetical protein
MPMTTQELAVRPTHHTQQRSVVSSVDQRPAVATAPPPALRDLIERAVTTRDLLVLDDEMTSAVHGLYSR